MKMRLSLFGVALIIAGNTNAALVASADGQTVYDTDLNVTWLANANLAATNTFGLTTGVILGTDIYGNQSIINSDGSMTWGGAQTWIAAMNAANYLGYNDWRLPTSDNCTGYNCTGSEMGHLFYTELGGLAGNDLATTHNSNYGVFQNILSSTEYWSGTEYVPHTVAYGFGFHIGSQGVCYESGPLLCNENVIAVRSGQVAPVPTPSAVWLLISGLIGLAGVTRKHKAA